MKDLIHLNTARQETKTLTYVASPYGHPDKRN